MSYPLLYFVDREGRKLPKENGYQYYLQYEEKGWYLQVEGDWDAKVGLVDESGSNIFVLNKNPSTNQWELPPRYTGKNKPKKRISDETVGSAGWTIAVLLDSESKPIPSAQQARLWIKPGSLSEADLSEIIAEIGLLALSVGNVFSYPSSLYQGEKTGEELGQNILPDGQLLTTSKALLGLYNLVRDLWTEIEKRPLRSFRREIISVDINKKFSSPRALISRKLGASKKQILTTSSVESLDCSENQFLCYVLDVYLKDIASGLIKLIEEFDDKPPSSSESIDLIPQSNRSNYPVDSKISSFWQEARKISVESSLKFARGKKQRSEILQQLNNCVQWSKKIRYNSFLKDIVTPDNPYLSSQRLIKSPTYGMILEAYNNCNGSHLHGIGQVIRLYRETLSLKVRATWQIYEIWCVVKVYSALITQLRLTPPINTKGLFESITFVGDEMSIPTNQEFKLQGKLVDETEINVSLWYDTTQSIGDLRPDIKLKTIINNQENIYFLDAKYKNYQAQGVEEFSRDVIGVAKSKYLERLSAKASFILHPDLKFDFWGEIPFKIFIKESQNADKTEYIAHKYGAIALIPGVNADIQINKFIRLIFQYHDNLCTTCLNCGCEAKKQTSWIPTRWSDEKLEREIIRGNVNGAIYCSCQQCGEFWVVQRCQGNHHLLLKFSNSFHKRSDLYPNSWVYMCPECGNDPDFS